MPGSASAEVAKPDLRRPDPIPVSRLVVGDCYQNPPDLDEVSSVSRSECGSGAVRVYWIEDLSWDFEGFPGQEHVTGYVDELCAERAAARFSVEGYSYGSPDDVRLWWWFPTAESWASGNALATCGFES